MFHVFKQSTKPLLVAGLTSLLWLSGCSTSQIVRDYDSQANFSSIKQVQWLPASMEKNAKASNFAKNNALNAVRVQKAIERALAAKSFTWTQAQPDAFIRFYVEEKRFYTAEQPRFSVGLGMGHNIRFGGIWAEPPPEYMERTSSDLVIEVLNTNGLVIWEAKSPIDFNESSSPQEKEQSILALVTEMLADFPPK